MISRSLVMFSPAFLMISTPSLASGSLTLLESLELLGHEKPYEEESHSEVRDRNIRLRLGLRVRPRRNEQKQNELVLPPNMEGFYIVEGSVCASPIHRSNALDDRMR